MAEEEQKQEQNSAVFKRRKGKEPAVVAAEEVDEAISSSSSSSSYRKIRGITMSFQLNCEANSFENSIGSLCNPKLNSELLGMVEVTTAKGFQITVRNDNNNPDNVSAFLFLNPAMLTNFRCSKPLAPHMIYLDSIYEFLILNTAPGYDTLFISHSESPDPNQQSHLTFKSEFDLVGVDKLDAPLIPLKDDPERFPDDIKIICFASIPSDFLLELINNLDEAQQVMMEVKCGLVNVYVGEQYNWTSKWHIECRTGQDQEPGMQCDAYFRLPHAGSILAALPVDPYPFMYFLSKPENHILLRFNLRGSLGELEFLSKAIRLDRKKIT